MIVAATKMQPSSTNDQVDNGSSQPQRAESLYAVEGTLLLINCADPCRRVCRYCTRMRYNAVPVISKEEQLLGVVESCVPKLKSN